jgi:MarR family 2-MHQ and catechol resistance regulon transcriptional repressor
MCVYSKNNCLALDLLPNYTQTGKASSILAPRDWAIRFEAGKMDTSGIHVWLIVWKSYEALSAQATESISSLDVCYTDFTILELLLHKGSQPINAIGSRLNLTSGSMTLAIDRLEKKQFVERTSDPNDRRARIVRLTPEGKKVITQSFKKHKKDMEKALDGLDEAERVQLITLLKQIASKKRLG